MRVAHVKNRKRRAFVNGDDKHKDVDGPEYGRHVAESERQLLVVDRHVQSSDAGTADKSFQQDAHFWKTEYVLPQSSHNDKTDQTERYNKRATDGLIGTRCSKKPKLWNNTDDYRM